MFNIPVSLPYCLSLTVSIKDLPMMVTAASLNKVIDGLVEANTIEEGHSRPLARTYIHLQNAADTPRWDYDTTERRFVQLTTFEPQSLGKASSKPLSLRRRFEIVRQRILRTNDFNGRDAVPLTSIKSIKGRTKEEGSGSRILLGLLSRAEDGRLCLEDPDDQIRLDFEGLTSDHVVPASYTEGALVVVGGVPAGDHFKVEFISPPPVESRSASTKTSSHPVYIGSLSESIHQLQSVETNYRDECLLILSDLWLDCPRTMAKFEQILQQLDSSALIPAAFILFGPFISTNSQGMSLTVSALRKAFATLAHILACFPSIQRRSKIILVPALDDPLAPGILPRAPLSSDFLTPLRQMEIDCCFVSNPCRIFFFTREIILFRHDLTPALKRHALCELPRHGDGKDLGFKTVLEQAHLCPLALAIQPRFWELDHALTVYPLILAERSRPTHWEQAECIGVNPGSFATANAAFTMLYPLQRRFESCNI